MNKLFFQLVLVFMASLACASSWAAFFEDDEARRAILELRQRVDSLRDTFRQSQQNLSQKQDVEILQIKRNFLEIQNSLETLRSEASKLRGSQEELAKDLSDLQRTYKDFIRAQDDKIQKLELRLQKIEPSKVSVDDVEFIAEPIEKKEFETALDLFRIGNFSEANSAFFDFNKKYPSSGYKPSVMYWAGNSSYAVKDYKEAMNQFRNLIQNHPTHARVPESFLSLANCQLDLKDVRSARKTLDDLIRNYPNTEAANAGKERLSSLK
ncbi:MAG: tol-pal system protein YbgF [Limnohabitans sp.]|nr:tol-pal system protein YbgF [Limnohabitans sp.]